MRKRVQIALAVLLVGLSGVIASHALREREPVYQGKLLRAWLREYYSPQQLLVLEGSGGYMQQREEARRAIRNIGTNAIPTMLKMLAEKELAPDTTILDFYVMNLQRLPVWIRHCGYRWHWSRAVFQQEEAIAGFEILGADAEQAVPALIKLYEQNVSPESQSATLRTLIAIGPSAQRMAIASFARAAMSSDAVKREMAADAIKALGWIDAKPRTRQMHAGE